MRSGHAHVAARGYPCADARPCRLRRQPVAQQLVGRGRLVGGHEHHHRHERAEHPQHRAQPRRLDVVRDLASASLSRARSTSSGSWSGHTATRPRRRSRSSAATSATVATTITSDHRIEQAPEHRLELRVTARCAKIATSIDHRQHGRARPQRADPAGTRSTARARRDGARRARTRATTAPSSRRPPARRGSNRSPSRDIQHRRGSSGIGDADRDQLTDDERRAPPPALIGASAEAGIGIATRPRRANAPRGRARPRSRRRPRPRYEPSASVRRVRLTE